MVYGKVPTVKVRYELVDGRKTMRTYVDGRLYQVGTDKEPDKLVKRNQSMARDLERKVSGSGNTKITIKTS